MDNQKQRPNFWAVIPATIRYDNIICSTAKLLFAEMTALSNREGYCWASNKYFAELFKISITQVSRLVASLEDRGFIKTFIERENGNQRKIYPQVTAESVVRENTAGKTFEQKFDDIVGVIAPELNEEKINFIEYWTATNDGGKKQHWQKQKTFAIRQRWATWIRNKRDWEKPNKKLPKDNELRENAKRDVMRKNREKANEERSREISKPRTKEEQESVDKRLAEMKKNLSIKFGIR